MRGKFKNLFRIGYQSGTGYERTTGTGASQSQPTTLNSSIDSAEYDIDETEFWDAVDSSASPDDTARTKISIEGSSEFQTLYDNLTAGNSTSLSDDVFQFYERFEDKGAPVYPDEKEPETMLDDLPVTTKEMIHFAIEEKMNSSQIVSLHRFQKRLFDQIAKKEELQQSKVPTSRRTDNGSKLQAHDTEKRSLLALRDIFDAQALVRRIMKERRIRARSEG